MNVVRATVGGGPVVIFWDRARQVAVAHRPTTGDRFLTFRVESGAVVDDETGSTWSVDGQAVEGPLEGERLDPVRDAHVAFWFAWAAFHPATFVLEGGTYVEPPIREGSWQVAVLLQRPGGRDPRTRSRRIPAFPSEIA